MRFAGEAMERKVWLFAMVLGHSRYLWAQFVMHQDLPTVLRCHMQAFGDQMGDQFPELVDEVQRLVDAAAWCVGGVSRG